MEMRASAGRDDSGAEKLRLKGPFPSVDELAPMDLDKDEDEALQRYETIFRAFVSRGVFKPLSRRLSKDDIGKNVQGSIIDFAVNHALKGEDYIPQIQSNMQYTVLQSALILTISMPLYIDPPSFNKTNNLRAFSAVIGCAAFCQMGVIIGCTIISALLNRPFTIADTVIARIEANGLLVIVTVINYVANAMTIVAMYIAGFDRLITDGAVQLYDLVIVLFLCYLAADSMATGSKYQDARAISFYEHYCEDDGRLKPEYLERVYSEKKEKKEK